MVEILFVGNAFDLYPVAFLLAVFRIGDALLQSAVVGQHQQTLAVVVEPSGAVHAGYIDVVGQRGLVAAGGELGQHP